MLDPCSHKPLTGKVLNLMSTDTTPSTKQLHRILKDSSIAVALLLALGVVYGLDPKKAPTPKDVVSDFKEEQVVEVIKDDAPVVRLRLGVTPADFDDMGKLLDLLGDGYRHDVVQLDELLDPEMYGKFDILFLTCGGVPDSWLLKEKVDAGSRGRGTFQARPEVLDKVTQNLQTFVSRGGTLYASDWRFMLVANAFGTFVDAGKAVPGKEQMVEAEVVDPGLREILGKTISLRFDQPDWNPAAFRGEQLVTYLKGGYQPVRGTEAVAPLLVKFPHGDGSVIFTSFHNEKQNSELETQLLKYLVFATVTAQTESKITKTMVAGGFSPSSSNLLSTSAEAPSVTRSWQCVKAGSAQFVLGFQNQGALLKLTVVGPGGRQLEQQGTSTFQIDVPDAAVGEWRYTVTAVKVPYANFPFTLTIGEK